MIEPELFKETKENILKINGNDFPSAPESLFSLKNTNDHANSLSFYDISDTGEYLLRKIVEIGKDVATSDLAHQVISADLTKHAVTGAVVGVGVAIAIPYSIVGLGAGAAIGASMASWRYLSK